MTEESLAYKVDRVKGLQEEIAELEGRAYQLRTEYRRLTGDTGPLLRGPVSGVGAIIKDLIRQGKNNDEILAYIREAYPKNHTSVANVRWYRWSLQTWPETNGVRPKKGS